MRRPCALLLALAGTALMGCIPDFTPPVIKDPARAAAVPGRFRGDSYDRSSLSTLQGLGAHFAAGSFDPAADAAVVREALRVDPPSAGRVRDVDARDARTMVFRRRPRAAYVALTEHMRSPDGDVRAGAVGLLGGLDARGGMRSAGHAEPPPWSGPEREAALVAAGAILLHDPDPAARKAAAWEFLYSFGPRSDPTPTQLVAALERESDPEMKDILLRVLGMHGAAAALHLAAIDKHAPSFMSAWMALDGLFVPGNRTALEDAYGRASDTVRQAILREADDLEGMQPWIEGLVLLGLADGDPVMRDRAAHLALKLPALSPAVVARLRAAAPTNGWATHVLDRHGAR